MVDVPTVVGRTDNSTFDGSPLVIVTITSPGDVSPSEPDIAVCRSLPRMALPTNIAGAFTVTVKTRKFAGVEKPAGGSMVTIELPSAAGSNETGCTPSLPVNSTGLPAIVSTPVPVESVAVTVTFTVTPGRTGCAAR